MYDNDFLFDMPEIPKLDGNCKGMPTDWWFPEHPMTQEQSRNAARAVEICDDCHEKEKCLEFAVTNPKIAGIWGGVGWKQRQTIRLIRNRKAAAERIAVEREKQKQIKLAIKGAKSA